MNDSLSNLVDNLSELYVCKCLNKKEKSIKIKYKEQNNTKIVCTRCKSCNTKNKQSLDLLIKKFPNTYKLCNNNINKFLLLLRKGVYPYEYMDDWDKFNEINLPSIDNFYSKLKLENIDKKDYNHALKVCDTFNIKNLGDYHDLYVQSDTAQLTDVFENFRSVCLNHYQLDPTYFVSTPGLALEAMLKITKVKIELLTDIDMVLMVENGIRVGLTEVVKIWCC